MTRARVLHVLGELNPSGAERMLTSAAPLFQSNGVESFIFAAGARHPFASTLRDAGYEVATSTSGSRVRWVVDFVADLRRVRPQVVHIHSERGFIYACLLARAVIPRVRLVRTVHSIFSYTAIHRVKRVARCYLARLLGVQWVSISEPVLTNERQRFRMPSTLIYNWVDVEQLQPLDAADRQAMRAALGLGPDAVLVSIVGNCGRAKRHELAVDAAAYLPERYWICHVGDESRMESIEAERLLTSAASNRVIRLGPRSDVERVLGMSDVFAMPSLYEGFGMSAVEAMCAGVPTVVVDTPGLTWLARFGARVAPSDAASLATAIQQAFLAGTDPTKTVACRDAFTPDRGVREYMHAYRILEVA